VERITSGVQCHDLTFVADTLTQYPNVSKADSFGSRECSSRVDLDASLLEQLFAPWAQALTCRGLRQPSARRMPVALRLKALRRAQ
jgi:hypothetical protein